MKTANGHTAAENRSLLQVQLAALMRATALRSAEIQSVYVVDAPASHAANKASYPTYYSYRYL